MAPFEIPPLQLFVLLLALGFLVIVWNVIRRLFFSPLAGFPGPKLAAATWWYEFYYDVVLGGKYRVKIAQLHEIYGPVLRINPEELHFTDPEFYDTIYASAASGKKRDRWPFALRAFNVQESVLGTYSHDHHRLRRSALNPFFSNASVKRLQPVVDRLIERFLGKLHEFNASRMPIVMDHAFAAYSNDVVMQYCFGHNKDRISAPDFQPEFYANLMDGLKMSMFLKHNAWIMRILVAMPLWFSSRIAPDYAKWLAEQNELAADAKEILEATAESSQDIEIRTIFHEIKDSKLPLHERTPDRLSTEAFTMVGAGTVTTSWTLTVALYYILADSKVLRKLRHELRIAFPDRSRPPNIVTVEQLPYLKGVVQEALRLADPVSNRIHRISHEWMTYTDPKTGKQWHIPPGTPCSIIHSIVHHNEKIFPNSTDFRPERWIENPRLDKYQTTFSRGTRICLGMNLAYTEMYLMLAGLFLKYGSAQCQLEGDEGRLELFETDKRDVIPVSDYNASIVWEGSKGVRIRVLPLEE